jgi:putative transposon-encoded protein
MSRARLCGAVGVTAALFVSLAVVGAAPAFAVTASLQTPGFDRNCQTDSQTLVGTGFLDNANGVSFILQFDGPAGGVWSSSSITANSDHYDISAAGPLTITSEPDDILWPRSIPVTLEVHESSGGALLTSATVVVPGCPAGFHTDFDGDGADDIVVFRPSTGQWFAWELHTAPYSDTFHNVVTTWGKQGDVPVPADYTGDGITDHAVFRPSNGTWYIQGLPAVQWGRSGDIPVPGYYVDNLTISFAVFRPSTSTWYVKDWLRHTWGKSGDIPALGDYNGNGMDELTVFRPSNGTWYDQDLGQDVWGKQGDVPVPGDYTGDELSEIAVFRPSNNTWYLQDIASFVWGKSGDIPVPGDYLGFDATDPAVFRPSTGTWYLYNVGTVQWGRNGDIPIKPLLSPKA